MRDPYRPGAYGRDNIRDFFGILIFFVHEAPKILKCAFFIGAFKIHVRVLNLSDSVYCIFEILVAA